MELWLWVVTEHIEMIRFDLNYLRRHRHSIQLRNTKGTSDPKLELRPQLCISKIS